MDPGWTRATRIMPRGRRRRGDAPFVRPAAWAALRGLGGQDPLIPAETVQQIRAGRPDGVIYLYPEAGHGFNCTDRADYHPVSAEQALKRTLAFIEASL